MALRAACLFVVIGCAAAQDAPGIRLRRAQGDLSAGRYAAAERNGAEALPGFRKAGDSSSEGLTLTVIGLAQLYSGEYDSALRSFTASVEISRRTHDPASEVTRLCNIGTVLYFEARYADAMDWYQRAFQRVSDFPREKWTESRRQFVLGNMAVVYQTVGQFERALDIYSDLLRSKAALPPSEQGQLLANVGTLQRRLGDPVKALTTYRQAQALYSKATHRDGEIAVSNNIGILQATDLHDYTAAAETFTSSLKLAKDSGDRPLAVDARLYRAEAVYKAGRRDQSASDFQAAADEAQTLGEPEQYWKALYGLARIALANGDKPRAGDLLRRAVARIESVRSDLGGSSLRSGFLADKRDVYDLLIAQTANVSDAFRLMEESRARTLQDRVRARRELQEVAHRLPTGTAVLEYWFGASEAAVLWFSRSATGIRRWPVAAGDKESIERLPSIVSDSAHQDWRESCRALARKILPPIPPLSDATINNLIIIPDGQLALVPFETLPLGDGRLLIERFAVSYSPSATLLQPGGESFALRWPWQKTFAAYADPAPGRAVQTADLESRIWPRLSQAAREVTGAARILGGRSVLHIGPDARREFLKRDETTPIVHFATHAFADPESAQRSYILFAPVSSGTRFDYLFLKEVYGLRFSGVQLVTASACQTDIGKMVRSEGVESFGTAFLVAGARSTVTSLWDVEDRASAELMLRFYSELASGESETDALRAAKLAFVRSPRLAHPAYWAAFVLNGDGNACLPRLVSWTWLSVTAGLLLACAMLLIRKRAGKA